MRTVSCGSCLWFSLLYGTMFEPDALAAAETAFPRHEVGRHYAYMLGASLVAFAVGSLFLGITCWDLLYHLVFIAVLVKKFALEELGQREARATSGPIQSVMAPGPLRPVER